MRKALLVLAGVGLLFVAAVLIHVLAQGVAESQGAAGTFARSTCSGCHGV